MKHPQSIKAFTLAETLIVLIIIGVVAVLTISVFIENHNKTVLHKQFLKTYSDLNKFSQKFMVDEGMSFSEYCANLNNAEKCFNRFMNDIGEIKRISKTEFESEEFKYSLRQPKGNKLDESVVYGSNNTICNGNTIAQDLNGRYFRLSSPMPFSYSRLFSDSRMGVNYDGPNGPKICVDINGNNQPNMHGFDYFVFIFTVDNKVIPFGMPDENNPRCSYYAHNCMINASVNCGILGKYSKNNGAYCSYWALQDKYPVFNSSDIKKYGSKSYWKDFI